MTCIYYCEVSETAQVYYGASIESKKLKKVKKGDLFLIKGIVRNFVKIDNEFVHSSKLRYYEDCSSENRLINRAKGNSLRNLNGEDIKKIYESSDTLEAE